MPALSHTSLTILSTKVPAWLLHTWQRYVTMAVSTCAFRVRCAISLASRSILYSSFAAREFIHGANWDRRWRSMQMQHGPVQPH